MGLGGPVWHASAAPRPGVMLIPSQLRRACERALLGVGDAALGEWVDVTPKAVHLRRRLSEVEAERVGPVVDVRRTPEAQRRIEAVMPYLEQAGVLMDGIVWEELP